MLLKSTKELRQSKTITSATLLGAALFIVFILSGCETETKKSVRGTETTKTTATISESKRDLESAVRSYTSAYLSGNGDGAYELLSQRCQTILTKSDMHQLASGAAEQYGTARLVSLAVQTNDDEGTATYRFDQPAIDQENEPWVLDNGKWKNDEC